MAEQKGFKNKLNTVRDIIVQLLDKYCVLFLFVIFAVFLFSRLFHLDITPAGIHYDEAGMAFDAKTLARYGTDRHNNSFPLYLPAYGGGQSALYAYSLALLLKFVPFSVFVMRLPAVIWGCLAFFSSFFLIKDVYSDKRLALMGPVLVTIIPYFFTSERWGLDCNLFLSLAVFSFCLFVRAHLKGRYRDYVFAGLALGLTLYTYVLSYIVLPIFVFISVVYVMIIFREDIRKFEFLKYVAMGTPTVILGLPLLLMQLINMGIIKPFRFWIFDFPKLGFYRGAEMSISAIPYNISRIWMMLFRGEQFTFTCLPGFNPVYIAMVPLIAAGFIIAVINAVRSIRDKEFTFEAFVLAFTIAGYIPVLLIKDPLNIYNGNELYFTYALYIVIFMRWVVSLSCLSDNEFGTGTGDVGKASMLVNSWIAVPVILCIFAVCFLRFSNYYFRHYNNELGIQYMFVSTEYGDVVSYANKYCNPDHKKLFFGRTPQHQSYGEVIVGMALEADPATWESNFYDNNMVDNVYLGLPDEEIIIERDDCVFIFSRETHGHIWPYFVEAGWKADETFASYVIIYK